jgi:DNA-binding PadR family transcriptional regulator
LGEFERLVLLAVLQNRDEGYAILVRREIERVTQRTVSRGALYRTLDRLETKGLVSWALEEETAERGGNPRKRFSVTSEGVAALRRSHAVLGELSSGLEHLLEPSP